jgi:hypothetical protein
MGGMIKDSTTSDVFHQMNTRMGPNEPVKEVAAVHKEFDMFSGKYNLKQAYRALHIAPSDHGERRKWFRYLDSLVDYKSDKSGVNGHDRIVSALRENFERSAPLPVYWMTHLAADDNRVLIGQGTPIPHEVQVYMTISLPTIPAGEAPKPTLAAARAKRAARKK